MEHRWGQRVGVDVPVRITAHPFKSRHGRLSNLSVSGAFIRADLELRVLSRIQVVIEMPTRFKHDAPVVAAYVARRTKDGIGIEWCEFAPKAVSDLLRTMTTRPHVRIRKHDPQPVAGRARVADLLLRHGS